jgi:hypothetical protein
VVGISNSSIFEAQNLVTIGKFSYHDTITRDCSADFSNFLRSVCGKGSLLFAGWLIANDSLLNSSIGKNLDNKAAVVSHGNAGSLFAGIIVWFSCFNGGSLSLLNRLIIIFFDLISLDLTEI